MSEELKLPKSTEAVLQLNERMVVLDTVRLKPAQVSSVPARSRRLED